MPKVNLAKFAGTELRKRKDILDGYQPLSKAKIDHKLRALVSDLNKKGFVTIASWYVAPAVAKGA